MIGPGREHRRLGCVTGTLLCLLVACAPQDAADAMAAPDLDELNRSLIEADRAFNRATQERGVDGWVSSFDADGAVILEGLGEITGWEAIGEVMGGVFSSPDVSLTWEPSRAHSSDDGTLGFTVGEFVSTSVGSGGDSAVAHGLYVSIWRKQSDGTWKVIMDLGNPTG